MRLVSELCGHLVCDMPRRWAEGSCFRREMVAAEYVGGCTVTFMALQVRALITLPSQSQLHFFSTTMALSCSDYCTRASHVAPITLRRQCCTWAAAAVLL